MANDGVRLVAASAVPSGAADCLIGLPRGPKAPQRRGTDVTRPQPRASRARKPGPARSTTALPPTRFNQACVESIDDQPEPQLELLVHVAARHQARHLQQMRRGLYREGACDRDDLLDLAGAGIESAVAG